MTISRQISDMDWASRLRIMGLAQNITVKSAYILMMRDLYSANDFVIRNLILSSLIRELENE